MSPLVLGLQSLECSERMGHLKGIYDPIPPLHPPNSLRGQDMTLIFPVNHALFWEAVTGQARMSWEHLRCLPVNMVMCFCIEQRDGERGYSLEIPNKANRNPFTAISIYYVALLESVAKDEEAHEEELP